MKLNSRVVVTAALMFSSAAGTLFVFSLGLIALPKFLETLFTSGGVALGTDAVATICAAMLGQIDSRIAILAKRKRNASKRQAGDLAAQISAFEARKHATFQAFIFACGVSAVANIIFRIETLGNVPLALFLGIIPPALMYILNAVLRPLPRDYEEEAQAATKEALIGMVATAAATVRAAGQRRFLREEDKMRLAAAYSALGTYSDEREMHNLRNMSHTLGLTVQEEPTAIDAQASQMLTVDDIVTRWGCSLRTAQDWMQKAPEARKVAGMWMAPEAAILARHPRMLQLPDDSGKRRRSGAKVMRTNEASMQENEIAPQADAEEAQEIAS